MSSASSSPSDSSSSSSYEHLFQISPDLVKSDSKIGPHLAFNRFYLVFVVDSCTIKAVEHHSPVFSPPARFALKSAVLDSPHSGGQHIKCIRLSHVDPLSTSGCLLMSCSPTSVLIWNMLDLFSSSRAPSQPRSIGEPSWFQQQQQQHENVIHECSFHPNSSSPIVAVSCGRHNSMVVLIVDVARNVRLDEITLDACVNLFEFARFNSNLLFVSIDTSRLVVHDFRARCQIQCVRGAQQNDSVAFVDICGLDDQPIVLLGSSNGLLHLYQFLNGRLILVRTIDISNEYGLEATTSTDDDDETCTIIGLDLFATNDTQQQRHLIACATLQRIYLIDAHSANLLASFTHSDSSTPPQRVDFSVIISDHTDLIASFLYVFKNEIDVVKLMRIDNNSASQETRSQQPRAAEEPEFHPKRIDKLNESFRVITPPSESTTTTTTTTTFIRPSVDDIVLTVFPTLSLLDTSPLNEPVYKKSMSLIDERKPKILSMHDYLKKSNSTVFKRDASLSLDKPLTFNSRIKSSGYNNNNNNNSTNSSKRERFQPMINKSATSLSLTQLEMDNKMKQIKSKAATATVESVTTTSSSSRPMKMSHSVGEFRFRLPDTLRNKSTATDKSSPIVDLKFTHDGQHFALVSSDNLIQYMSSAQPEKTGLSLSSHQDVVNSVDVSHNGKYLISSSRDKSCKIWSLQKMGNTASGKVVLDMRSVEWCGQPGQIEQRKQSQQQQTTVIEFKREPTCAQFFYLDKFVLVGSDKSLLVCKYHIDTTRNDIQRYANNSSCRAIAQLAMNFSQTISCMSAVNSFYSYLVLCAGSNKDIEVFDLNEMRSCLTIHEAHTRPVGQLVQNASEFNQMSYDVFASNSTCDGVKLWDLRAAKCVARLDSHLNRFLATKCSFSADSCYLAAGSEDRTVGIYDLRMMCEQIQYVKKYGVLSDSVTCAQFNPRRSQLLCATLDGKLFNYQD